MLEYPYRIEEALLDPKWQVGAVVFEGMHIIRLSLFHPRHGQIDMLMPMAEAEGMAAVLTKAVEDVAEQRLRARRGE